MKTTLDKLNYHEECTVLDVKGDRPIKRRIFDMGITPGTIISFRKVAPMGDPLEIIIRGYSLSLRKSEAKNIIVDK